MEFSASLILIDIISFACVCVLYFIVREKDLKFSILWLSLFSMLSCILYLVMDAPDVAMTEAALGACITTIIFLRLAHHSKIFKANLPNQIRSNEQCSIYTKLIGLIVSISFGSILIYAGQDLPIYGSSETPVQLGVQEYYNVNTYDEIGIPSFVAAILASYRGYDTLGETSVIFIAGICVVMIMNTASSSRD